MTNLKFKSKILNLPINRCFITFFHIYKRFLKIYQYHQENKGKLQ